MKNNSFACFARAFLDISQTFSLFPRREMTCLQLGGPRELMMTNFVFISLNRWSQFNSRIVRTHFGSVMTLNN